MSSRRELPQVTSWIVSIPHDITPHVIFRVTSVQRRVPVIDEIPRSSFPVFENHTVALSPRTEADAPIDRMEKMRNERQDPPQQTLVRCSGEPQASLPNMGPTHFISKTTLSHCAGSVLLCVRVMCLCCWVLAGKRPSQRHSVTALDGFVDIASEQEWVGVWGALS